MTMRNMIEAVSRKMENFGSEEEPEKMEMEPEKLEMEPVEGEGEDNVDVEQKILQFFMENPSPEDDAFHAFAQSLGMEPDDLETKVYGILSSLLSGGKSQGNEDFGPDEEQLAMGIEVEKEHTDNEFLARKIALDHLASFPTYYTALKEMESNLEKNGMGKE